MATGDPTGVEPLLDLVESLARPRPDRRSWSTMTRTAASRPWSRSTGPASPSSPATSTARSPTRPRVLDLVGDGDHLQRGAAAALLGLAHWSRGDLDDGPATATPSRSRCFEAGGYLADVMGCSLALADIQLAQGRLRDAQRTFESALRHTDRRTPGCAAPPTCTSG